MIARLIRSAIVLLLVDLLVAGAPAYGQAQNQSQSQSQDQSQSPPQTPQAQAPPQDQAQAQPAPRPNFTLSTKPDYSHGQRWFPEIWKPYTPINVAAPVLANSPRIDQLIKDGQIFLSLNDAISLALENNLDIAVQRYIPWIADTDLLRTEAGGVARGLGGTGTATALGAIPGASFDPNVSSTLFLSHSTVPVNNGFLSGTGLASTGAVNNNNAQANFTYAQAFHTGTALSLAFDNLRQSTSSTQAFLNPAVTSLATISVQQQLLNGFGLLPNTRFILEAKNNRKVADLTLAGQVITSVSAVENAYWELVFARQNVTVQEAAVKTSQKLYGDNKRQVEIGTLAPIEVVRAESQLATDQQNLIVAQTVQLQDQSTLLNLITRDPLGSAQLLNLDVVPTDVITTPPPTDVMPLQDAVKEAWQKRPEIREAELNLKTAGIEVRATRNALLPIATLFAQYGANGLGGTSRTTTVTPTMFAANLNSPIVTMSGAQTGFFNSTVTAATVTPGPITPGGFGDAFSELTTGKFPSYSVGMSLSIPIRNRSAQADNARALLDERQVETQYRQLQNSVILDVRNAQILLQQGRARVEAAEKARVLAQQTLDAEQKKYQLGASTVFLVIQAQRDLTTAQGNEIRAKADLAEAKVAFDKAMGRTLDVNNITIADAKRGHIHRDPLIPGTPTAEIFSGAK
jgi:outer membrane protein